MGSSFIFDLSIEPESGLRYDEDHEAREVFAWWLRILMVSSGIRFRVSGVSKPNILKPEHGHPENSLVVT
jgi:hypothetical protein